MKIRIISILILITLYSAVVAQNSNKIDRLDAVFSQSIKDWDVPGMGIAIVTKDSVLLSKGYGIKDIKTGEPVDENTIFAVASNSKAFTASSVALLVD